jgi:superfamily II DNA/RNA helicase
MYDVTDINWSTIEILGSQYQGQTNRPIAAGQEPQLLPDFNRAVLLHNEELGFHVNLAGESEPARLLKINGYDHIKDIAKFLQKRSAYHAELIGYTFKNGFEYPTMGQKICIPEVIQGNDSVVQFKSGTGKTFIYSFGMLWRFDPEDPNLQIIVVVNAQVVAKQIIDQVKKFVGPNVKIALCIGRDKDAQSQSSSSSFGRSSRGFSGFSGGSGGRTDNKHSEKQTVESAQILICTMGKLHDFLVNQQVITLTNSFKMFCIDEFDCIVNAKSNKNNRQQKSTSEQIKEIIALLPKHTQRLFYSATVDDRDLRTVSSYVRPQTLGGHNPFFLKSMENDQTLEGVRQYYVECENVEIKMDVLCDVFTQATVDQCMIFANTIEMADRIKKCLSSCEPPIPADVYHREISSIDKQKVLDDFKNRKTKILIASNVMARGMDFPSVNLVINFDMPVDFSTYVHRCGRSGRYGRKGYVINFVLNGPRNDEMAKIEIIKSLSEKSPLMALPEDFAELIK